MTDRTSIDHLEDILDAAEKAQAFVEGTTYEYPQVPWSSMAGMRDNLIHDYSDVDRELVWRTVQKELPELRRHLRTIVEDLQE